MKPHFHQRYDNWDHLILAQNLSNINNLVCDKIKKFLRYFCFKVHLPGITYFFNGFELEKYLVFESFYMFAKTFLFPSASSSSICYLKSQSNHLSFISKSVFSLSKFSLLIHLESHCVSYALMQDFTLPRSSFRLLLSWLWISLTPPSFLEWSSNEFSTIPFLNFLEWCRI